MEERRDSNGSHRQCSSLPILMPVPACLATTRTKKASCAPYTIILSGSQRFPPLQNQFHQGYWPFCHRHRGAVLDREFYRSAFKQCSGRQCGNTLFPGKSRSLLMRDAVSVQYIGSNMDADNSKQFDITVERLATRRSTRRVSCPGRKWDFVPGNYSFDLNTNLSSYEFQYTISGRDTNETVQRKIMRLINNANIGLNATLVSNDRGQNALPSRRSRLVSCDSEQYLFEITPAPDRVPYAPCARSASTTSRKCRSIRSFC